MVYLLPANMLPMSRSKKSVIDAFCEHIVLLYASAFYKIDI